MRKHVLLIIFLLPWIFAIAQERGMKPIQLDIEGTPTTLYTQSHALIIGVSNYYNGWPDLPGVKKDIIEVKSALQTKGFNVVVVEDPNDKELEDAYNNFIDKYGVNTNNRLLFYFAGHGYTMKATDGRMMGYIVPSNAPLPHNNQADFHRKAISMRSMEKYARDILSKHALFMFDACFSGQLFNLSRAVPASISYKTTKPVRQFITSGSADEEVPDQSLFRKYFVEAITTNDADANNDGYLTVSELSEYLFENVTNYSYNNQHPQYGKIRDPYLDKGDFVFVLNESGAPATQVIAPTIEEERNLIKYGKLKIITEIKGILYLDGNQMKQVNANTVITLNNLTEGIHTVKVSGEETVEKRVTIHPDRVTSLTIEKSRKATKGAPCPGMPTFTDPRDGQVYPTVQIGTQCWMQKNMNYPTGNCWCYDNKNSNCDIYGRLYDWETAKIVCPYGWHLPNDEEWNILIEYLGGKYLAEDKMREVGTDHWRGPNEGATNSSGFCALPGGCRSYNRHFLGLWDKAGFWSSDGDDNLSWGRLIGREDNRVHRGMYVLYSFSVRCIKD